MGRTTRHGAPTATTRLGMSFVTTLPAPTTEPAPIVTPGMTTALPPIQTSSSTCTGTEYWLPSTTQRGLDRVPRRRDGDVRPEHDSVADVHVGVIDDHKIEVRVEAVADIDVRPIRRQERWLDPDRLAHRPQQLAQQSQSLLGLARPGVVVVVEQLLAVHALGFESLQALTLIDIQLAGVHPRPDGVFVHHHTRVREEPDASVAIGPAA